MDLDDLITALLRYDALSARQWVADAARIGILWKDVPPPAHADPTRLAVAAGVAELLAERSQQEPPAWTRPLLRAPRPVYLVQAALTMPRLRILCEREGPEPLRSRDIYAPPEFLTAA